MDSPTPQRNAFEDSRMEIVDVATEQAKAKLAQQQATMAIARAAHEDPNHEGGGMNKSFYTADGKGIATNGVANNLEKAQPWHYTVMVLRAQGMSYRDIASRVGKAATYVSNLCRANWFREQLEAYLVQDGRETIQELIRAEGANSIYTLIDVRDDPSAKGSERVAAAKELLDRLMGKAPQTVQHVDGGRSEVAKEQDRIERELADVEKELRTLDASVALPAQTAEGGSRNERSINCQTPITPTLL